MFRFRPHLVMLTALAASALLVPRGGASAADPPVRFATFNASLNRNNAGQAAGRTLSTPGNAQADTVAEIIQRVRPDVLLINEFDFEPTAVGWPSCSRTTTCRSARTGAAPRSTTPTSSSRPSNTGIPSGFDLNNNGARRRARTTPSASGSSPASSAWPSSRSYPIDRRPVRTFQNFLWKDMPGALLPDDPATPGAGRLVLAGGARRLPALVEESLGRARSTSAAETVHFLVSHPTPPVFDGPEDRNGTRNFDEIRFWADYITPARRRATSTTTTAATAASSRAPLFVIAGDQNSDPLDGDSIPGAIQQLLEHPLVNTKVTPSSAGAVEASGAAGRGQHDPPQRPARSTPPTSPTPHPATCAPTTCCRART